MSVWNVMTMPMLMEELLELELLLDEPSIPLMPFMMSVCFLLERVVFFLACAIVLEGSRAGVK